VHIRGLHPALEGLRIGLLTDMHATAGRGMEVFRHALGMMAAEGPDLVALTGDFIAEEMGTFKPVFEAAAAGLHPPLGTFAVPGNHDHHAGIGLWERELREYPSIHDLTNRSTMIDVRGARLCLAGVDDFAEGRPSLDSLPPIESRDLTILLAHNPDQAERARRSMDRIDLIVSGHTHGGQLRLPLLGPIASSVDHPHLYEEGLRRRPWTQVYTSRGLGMVRVPARLLTRPEITVLKLTGAPREKWVGGRMGRRFPTEIVST
jgi:predicted MPP superfamily phosphohydrolase